MKHIWYLAGPIGFTTGDEPIKWRTDITTFLATLGHTVIDPMKKEVESMGGDLRGHFNKLRETGNLAELRGMCRRHIIGQDLNAVNNSTMTLIYAPKGVHMCGTYGEATWAYGHGKPVFVVSNMNPEDLPNWLVGCSTIIFNSFREFKKFFGK